MSRGVGLRRWVGTGVPPPLRPGRIVIAGTGRFLWDLVQTLRIRVQSQDSQVKESHLDLLMPV